MAEEESENYENQEQESSNNETHNEESSKNDSNKTNNGNKSNNPKDWAKNKAAEKLGENEHIARAQQAAEFARNAVHAVQSFIASAKDFISGFVSTVTNPYFWIALAACLAIFLTVTGIYSTSQVVGPNENIQCANTDSGSSNVGVPKDKKEAANMIGNWLTSTNFQFLGNKPMTKDMAAAWVGNFTQESQLDTSASNGNFFNKDSSNQDIIARGASAGATGLAQWMGPRLIGLGNYANEKSAKWNDLSIQLQYIQKELDTGGYGQTLVSNGFKDGASVDDLAFIINKVYEGSGESKDSDPNQKRVAYAKDFLSTFTGGNGAGSSLLNSVGNCPGQNVGSIDNEDGAGYMRVAQARNGGVPGPGVYVVDIYSMYWGECTSFASYFVNKEWGVSDEDQMAGKVIFSNNYKGAHFGNGGEWDNAAKQLGIPVDTTPAPGAAAILHPSGANTSGHVAIVTAVHPDGTIDVAENNVQPPSGHKFGVRKNIPVAGNFNVFIHFEQAKPNK